MEQKQKPFKFVVRLPLTLRNQIADAAKYYRRSMNSEIVARLEQSFSGILTEVREDDVAPPMHAEIASIFGRGLTNEEEQLINAYRRMSEEKQSALIELLT